MSGTVKNKKDTGSPKRQKTVYNIFISKLSETLMWTSVRQIVCCCHCLFVCLFYGYAGNKGKFQGQGLNLTCSCDPCYSSSSHRGSSNPLCQVREQSCYLGRDPSRTAPQQELPRGSFGALRIVWLLHGRILDLFLKLVRKIHGRAA